eukprot:TRINITY_DN58283_c0_g1_i1.p1 TRINITY_DN58283_c0_g1~~TRINITY_DN58283_c0_g1_i1.p1  ORF type:complete len:653 (-),score=135.48 TRINITY_DN58283_c0_g1_i1:108-2066(-)
MAEAGKGNGNKDSLPSSVTQRLLEELASLEGQVQSRIRDSLSFRKANSSFDVKNETTQLLLAVCERLSSEKAAMDQANFAEHTSELSYLCQHYGTSLDSGLTDVAYRDKLSAFRVSLRKNERPRSRRPLFAFCCQSEFPPQQAWWFDVKKRLVPKYTVLRGGKVVTTDGAEVVPGDVVFLQAGQKAAADGRVLVHVDGTVVDVSNATVRTSDCRSISTQATAVTPAESNNIVLKDSYVVSGALFCMVVRPPRNPFIVEPSLASAAGNGNGTDQSEGGDIQIETSIPPGLTYKSCQNVFKNLCLKAHLACKSFYALSQLAAAQTLVVLLSQELLSTGTVPKFCAAVRKLGKSLVLVNCDCPRSSLMSIDSSIECVDFADFGDCTEQFEGYICASEEPMSCRSTRISEHGASQSLCAATAHVVAARLGEPEQAKICTLSQELNDARRTAVILNGISQAGLLYTCQLLRESDRPLLYAVGQLHYPRCFRSFIGTSNAESRSERPPAPCFARCNSPGASHSRHVSLISTTPGLSARCPTMEGSPRVGEASQQPESPSDSTPSPGREARSRPSVNSVGPYTMERAMSTRSHDPAAALNANPPKKAQEMFDFQRGDGQCCDVLVSLNSIGIVSENADCILLKSDLELLGQALEIVSKL